MVRSITAAFLLLACAARTGLAETAVAPDPAPDAAGAMAEWPGRTGRYVFEVIRDGTPIGRQSIEIRRDGDAVTAVTESKVAVKVLGLVVYRMHQVITERYDAGRLVSVRAETEDGSGTRVAELARDGDSWAGRLNKEIRRFDCDCAASPMWQIDSAKGSAMIEASQARLRKIRVQDRGLEQLKLPRGSVSVRHFSVHGEIEREVWYDSTGNLVAAQQFGSDGSMIRQNLIEDPASSSP